MLHILVVMVVAFVGTMLDNAFAFAAQLAVSPVAHHRRLGVAQWCGVLGLVAISLAIGTVLAVLPLHAVAVLAIAPLAFAFHAWRHPSSLETQPRRGVTTTVLVTFALGGDNVAIWSPLLRASPGWHRVVAVATILLLDTLLVLGATGIARHPRALAAGRRLSVRVLPVVYLALAVVILAECGWW